MLRKVPDKISKFLIYLTAFGVSALMAIMLIHITKESIQDYKDLEHAEVGIRRHFIEDFIETDEDLHKIVHPYHAHTLKTEFVIEEG